MLPGCDGGKFWNLSRICFKCASMRPVDRWFPLAGRKNTAVKRHFFNSFYIKVLAIYINLHRGTSCRWIFGACTLKAPDAQNVSWSPCWDTTFGWVVVQVVSKKRYWKVKNNFLTIRLKNLHNLRELFWNLSALDLFHLRDIRISLCSSVVVAATRKEHDP